MRIKFWKRKDLPIVGEDAPVRAETKKSAKVNSAQSSSVEEFVITEDPAAQGTAEDIELSAIDRTATATAAERQNVWEQVSSVEVSSEELARRSRLPLWSKIFYCIGSAALVVYVASMFSRGFADFFNRYIGSFFRGSLSYLSVWLPFSLAEIALITVPIWGTLLIVYASRHYCWSWRTVLNFLLILLSVVSLLFSLFVFGLGTGYYNSTIDVKLGLERTKVTPKELVTTLNTVAEGVNDALNEKTPEYDENGASVMPFTYGEMCEKLVDAYDKVREEYSFIPGLDSRVKPVMLSKPWTYTHISGVYTYFTGEANINTNMPDYTIPFTAAHEMAHQRGISREDEANFVAFLVCTASDDPYIRYSGYLSMFEYVASPTYSADKEEYAAALKKLNPAAVGEMIAYNEFYDKYADSVASTVTSAVNDTFLKSQGTPGEKSYGMVVDLAVAYYREK